MSIVEDIKKDWEAILDGDSKKIVDYAERFGELLNEGKEQEKLSTSQIRNVFNEVKQMRYDPDKLNLLRPKLAYTAGRHKGNVMKLQEVLDTGIVKVDSEEKFLYFQQFFEAILAYHRYYGGK